MMCADLLGITEIVCIYMCVRVCTWVMCVSVDACVSMLTLIEQTQGRRQEFFHGRALGGSRGGLPSHFFKFQGGGAQPRFLVASMVKMKEFRGQRHVHYPIIAILT